MEEAVVERGGVCLLIFAPPRHDSVPSPRTYAEKVIETFLVNDFIALDLCIGAGLEGLTLYGRRHKFVKSGKDYSILINYIYH